MWPIWIWNRNWGAYFPLFILYRNCCSPPLFSPWAEKSENACTVELPRGGGGVGSLIDCQNLHPLCFLPSAVDLRGLWPVPAQLWPDPILDSLCDCGRPRKSRLLAGFFAAEVKNHWWAPSPTFMMNDIRLSSILEPPISSWNGWSPRLCRILN